jgi:hypothetical protein
MTCSTALYQNVPVVADENHEQLSMRECGFETDVWNLDFPNAKWDWSRRSVELCKLRCWKADCVMGFYWKPHRYRVRRAVHTACVNCVTKSSRLLTNTSWIVRHINLFPVAKFRGLQLLASSRTRRQVRLVQMTVISGSVGWNTDFRTSRHNRMHENLIRTLVAVSLLPSWLKHST